MKHFIIFLFLCPALYAQTCYDKAWEAYTFGNYDNALEVIRECTGSDPVNHRLFFLEGKVLEGLYRYEQAIASYMRVLQLNSESMEAKSALAALYLQSGQPKASAALYEQLTMKEPRIHRWKISWATALNAAGNYKNALELLESVVPEDSLNWVIYKDMGDCHYRLNNILNAAYCYRKSLDYYPRNHLLYVQLMKLYILLQEYGAAIETGNEAVTLDSLNVEAWKHTGVAWYRSGIPDSSGIAFKKALALGDTSVMTSRHYGILRYFAADYHQAEHYLSKALLDEPNNLNTMHYLAITYGYTGKAEKGLALIDSINNSVAYYDTVRINAEVQRGYLYRILYKYDEAAKSFISVTRAKPGDTRNYYEVAVSYDMARKKKIALDWYIRFLNKLDPDWATKEHSDTGKQKSFREIAMDRVSQLRTDLFFEENKNSP